MTSNDRDLILKIFDKLDKIDANVADLKAATASMSVLVDTQQNKLTAFEARIKILETASGRAKTWALTAIVGALISAIIGWEIRKLLP